MNRFFVLKLAADFKPTDAPEWIESLADAEATSLGAKLVSSARHVFLDGVANGTSKEEIKKQLVEKWGEAKTVAGREAAITTALHTCYNRGRFNGYLKDKGVEYLEFSAILDEATTELCQGLNGKVFRKDEAEEFMPPCHWSCFSSGTRVLTDQGFKLFQALNGDEKFLSMKMDKSLEFEFVPAEKIITQGAFELITIINESIELRVTPDHQIVIWDESTGPLFKKAEDLEIGDQILNEVTHFSPSEIKKLATVHIEADTIKRVPYDGLVYCVALERNHTLYVEYNGKCCWCGNCRSMLVPYVVDEPVNEADIEDKLITNDNRADFELEEYGGTVEEAFDDSAYKDFLTPKKEGIFDPTAEGADIGKMSDISAARRGEILDKADARIAALSQEERDAIEDDYDEFRTQIKQGKNTIDKLASDAMSNVKKSKAITEHRAILAGIFADTLDDIDSWTSLKSTVQK